MLNIAVFGSGKGSNFQAILTAIQKGSIPDARVCLVISNNSSAGILEIARANSIPALHLSRKRFLDEQSFVETVLDALHAHRANFIALAGYMKRLDPRVIREFHGRVINIHPALLPQFGGQGMYGMHVHEAVIASGSRQSGATVHLVDEEYDHGAIVLQKTVPVVEGDTPETLAARVLAVEHAIYPEAVRLFAEGKSGVGKAETAVHHS